MANTTLSERGKELASGPSIRDGFKSMLGNLYHPEKNPDGFVNIGVAENYAMIPEVQKFLYENVNMQALDLTYGEGPWGTIRLRTAMAKHMTKAFPSIEKIDPDHLLFASGVTSLCELLGYSLFDEGDGILVPSPIYQAFPIDFGEKPKAKCIHVRFGKDDQFAASGITHWESTLLSSEKAGTKIRALMLCNPHNPLGKCYPKATIIELMKFCAKHKIHLLCDEIYASSVYDVPDADALPFTSALSFDYTPYISSDYVHVIYGMSKDLAAGGIRVGCIYTKNEELMRAMSSIGQFSWSGTPSELVATTMLEDVAWLENFLETSRQKLAHSNKLCRRLLDEMGVEYATGANAGFFLLLDLRPFLPGADEVKAHEEVATKAGEAVTWSNADQAWRAEELLFKRLMEKSVFLTNGGPMATEEPGFFRLVFSHEERTLREGLKRIGKVIGRELKNHKEMAVR